MRAHTLTVPMIQRDTLTLPEPAAGDAPRDGHRGVWFYEPAAQTGRREIAPGDYVRFVTPYGEDLAVGFVTGRADPDAYPKWCSRVNHSGFTWRDAPLWKWQEMKRTREGYDRIERERAAAVDAVGGTYDPDEPWPGDWVGLGTSNAAALAANVWDNATPVQSWPGDFDRIFPPHRTTESK